MEKFLYPNHPVRCITTGSSECGKSVFLTNLILNIITEVEKINIHSPSLHQDLYQKVIKCFLNYVPIKIILNILSAEDIDVVIDEIVNKKAFEKSNTELETFESIDEFRFPQEYDDGGIIILDDLNEKEMNDPGVQAMFKRSGHNKSSLYCLKITTNYPKGRQELAEISATYSNPIVSEIIYQDKSSMDMTLNEKKILISTCWNEKNQPLTIDMNKDKYTGWYQLGLNWVFILDSSPL